MKPEDKQKNYALAEKLLSEQNFAAAVIGGAIAAVLAAIIYSLTVVMWPFSYVFAAVGIGIAIGCVMQYLGRGIQTRFAVAAAIYTIAGCLLGNVFRAVMLETQGGWSSLLDVFSINKLSAVADWSSFYFSFTDLVFWFIAVWSAVFLVKRPLSRSGRLAIRTYESKE